MSSRAMKKLSEKQKTIQEQANLLREKKDGSTDGPSSKNKEIMAAAENINDNERAYANIAKMLGKTETVSTKAMNNALNELS